MPFGLCYVVDGSMKTTQSPRLADAGGGSAPRALAEQEPRRKAGPGAFAFPDDHRRLSRGATARVNEGKDPLKLDVLLIRLRYGEGLARKVAAHLRKGEARQLRTSTSRAAGDADPRRIAHLVLHRRLSGQLRLRDRPGQAGRGSGRRNTSSSTDCCGSSCGAGSRSTSGRVSRQ